ncbi:MAG: transcription termination factor Rho, partial [Gammaproteobacteria bacterium]|nr:transcription termination factor Rho [Gammaproteobacteria bacterium]
MIHLTELKSLHIQTLTELAQQRGIELPPRRKKDDLILSILHHAAKQKEDIIAEGFLEINTESGYGFLRSPENSYGPGMHDIYVSSTQIRRLGLTIGDKISGTIRAPKDSERYFAILKIMSVNDETPERIVHRRCFDELTPVHVNRQYRLAIGNGSTEDLTARVIDLISPFGPGQRGLIVSQPKAGKTMMLQNIARSITHN